MLRKWLGIGGERPEKEARTAFEVQVDLLQTDTPTIFDVGAYHGDIADLYLSLRPAATIHAFEPFPTSFEALARRFASNSRVQSVQAALSNVAGGASFFTNESAPTNSLLRVSESGPSYWGPGLLGARGAVDIQTKTLDQYMEESGVEQVDILKLDVQGAEYLVLEGAAKALSESRIGQVYMEIILADTYEGQHVLEEYLGFLRQYGFLLWDLYHPVRKSGRLGQADFLFAHSSLMDADEG